MTMTITLDELKEWVLDNTLVAWTKHGWLGEERVSTEKLLQKLDQLDTGESKAERRLADVKATCVNAAITIDTLDDMIRTDYQRGYHDLALTIIRQLNEKGE